MWLWQQPHEQVRHDDHVQKKWWLDPFGLPPAVARQRQRVLKEWEVVLFRVFFVVFPLFVAAVAVATSNIGMTLLGLQPIFQFFVMPDHQRDQVLGRK